MKSFFSKMRILRKRQLVISFSLSIQFICTFSHIVYKKRSISLDFNFQNWKWNRYYSWWKMIDCSIDYRIWIWLIWTNSFELVEYTMRIDKGNDIIARAWLAIQRSGVGRMGFSSRRKLKWIFIAVAVSLTHKIHEHALGPVVGHKSYW